MKRQLGQLLGAVNEALREGFAAAAERALAGLHEEAIDLTLPCAAATSGLHSPQLRKWRQPKSNAARDGF